MNANNGTVNSATLTSDRFGNTNSAYDFDGIDDWIDILVSGASSGNSEATLNAWFKLNNTSNGVSYIVSFGNNSGSQNSVFGMGEYGTSGMHTTFAGSQFDAISQITCPLNNWHMMTATHI